MTEWPFLLGNNAAGIPRVFAGTSKPIDVGIGSVHGRLMYGRLDQSDYTGIVGDSARRFTTGILLSYRPRGIEGLEIGAARMFDLAWPVGGLGRKELRKPFEGFLKSGITGDSGLTNNSSFDNQLASAFFRWALPRSGFELYGEFGREDHSVDARDFVLEPEHSMRMGVGFKKAWRKSGDDVDVLTSELFDAEPSTLGRFRSQGGLYAHGSAARQGHTQRGQVLGAGSVAIAGSAFRLGWERWNEGGEARGVALTRTVTRENPSASPTLAATAVQYEGGMYRRINGRGHLLRFGVSGIKELNRNLSADANSFSASIELTW